MLQAGFGPLKRRGQRQDGRAVLARGDAAVRERFAVEVAFDPQDDRLRLGAGAQEIGVHAVRHCGAFDRPLRRHQRLRDDLAPKDARGRAGPLQSAEEIGIELFDVEQRDEFGGEVGRR